MKKSSDTTIPQSLTNLRNRMLDQIIKLEQEHANTEALIAGLRHQILGIDSAIDCYKAEAPERGIHRHSNVTNSVLEFLRQAAEGAMPERCEEEIAHGTGLPLSSVHKTLLRAARLDTPLVERFGNSDNWRLSNKTTA